MLRLYYNDNVRHFLALCCSIFQLCASFFLLRFFFHFNLLADIFLSMPDSMARVGAAAVLLPCALAVAVAVAVTALRLLFYLSPR